MKAIRYKQIINQAVLTNNQSLLLILQQIANEISQERIKKKDCPNCQQWAAVCIGDYCPSCGKCNLN